MRVVLIGPAVRRQRLRALLPDGMLVIAEASSMRAARALGLDTDAYLIKPWTPEDLADDDAALVEALTAREVQVLELVADGLPNKAIAARLGVSDETVKFHLGSVFGKLGASNRTDAVRLAVGRGLVSL